MAKKVFVSGCYDLLHSGHVEFFQQASRYGDLYVGLMRNVGSVRKGASNMSNSCALLMRV